MLNNMVQYCAKYSENNWNNIVINLENIAEILCANYCTICIT